MEISVYKGSMKEHGAELDVENETLIIHKRHPFWIIGMVSHEQLHLSVYECAGEKACLQFDNIMAFWSDIYEYELGIEDHCYDYGYYNNDQIVQGLIAEQTQQASLDKWLRVDKSHTSIVNPSKSKRHREGKEQKQSNCQTSNFSRVSTVKHASPYIG